MIRKLRFVADERYCPVDADITQRNSYVRPCMTRPDDNNVLGHSADLSTSSEADVLIVDREVVDSAIRRRDPARHLTRLNHGLHQTVNEGAVQFCRQPFVLMRDKRFMRDQLAIEVSRNIGPCADRAPELPSTFDKRAGITAAQENTYSQQRWAKPTGG